MLDIRGSGEGRARVSQWVRLWEDMPNDPKWRVVARRSGRPVSEVLAVFIHMMINAREWAHRGELDGWNDEVVAIATDCETEHVTAICNAMDGLVTDGKKLRGWEKRQPKREDNSTERVREHRERGRAERTLERDETHCNEHETVRNAPEAEEKREDKKDSPPKSSLRSDLAPPQIGRQTENLGATVAVDKPKRAKPRMKIDPDAQPTEKDRESATEAGLSPEQFRAQWRTFRDHHLAKGSLMADWGAAWRQWLGNVDRFGTRDLSDKPPPKAFQQTYNMGGGASTVTEENLRKAVRMYAESGKWIFDSPPPGSPGHRVPDEFLPPEYQQKRLAEAG